MAIADDKMNDAAVRLGGRWQHPRLLALLTVLAVGLSVNALVNGGALSTKAQWKGIELFDKAAFSVDGEAVDGAKGLVLDRAKTCGRIHSIVETACGFRQRGRDRDGLRRCMAYELKYTMWSAYGCQ